MIFVSPLELVYLIIRKLTLNHSWELRVIFPYRTHLTHYGFISLSSFQVSLSIQALSLNITLSTFVCRFQQYEIGREILALKDLYYVSNKDLLPMLFLELPGFNIEH